MPRAGFKLGVWANNQRLAARTGKMSEARRAKLANAGIVFDPHRTVWDEGLAHFKKFRPNARVRLSLRERRILDAHPNPNPNATCMSVPTQQIWHC